jgi:L-iditol 2-dehydrogenase
MQALVKTSKGVGNVELKEVDTPKINEDEVLIEVKAAGICGSDILIYYDRHANIPPMIMGHEFAGVIDKVGKQVTNWSEGDRVVSETSAQVCRSCFFCRSGNHKVCPEKKVFGIGTDGAFAKYVKVPAWLLHKIPPNVSFEEAALSEPTAVVVHALIERTRINTHDFLTVLGAGPIGLISAQASISAGAETLITGTSADAKTRLKLAHELGIKHVINVETEDLISKVMDLTQKKGADIVVDASGAEPALHQAFEIVSRLGIISAIGITGKDYIKVPWDKLIFKAPRIIYNFSSKFSSWEKALAMMSTGAIKLKPMVTKFSLKDWEIAFKKVESKEIIKGVLIPGD